jgi:hypothetical protein
VRPLAAILATAACALLLEGCSNKPPIPDWQTNAHDSALRAVAAYMNGDARAETAEFDRARVETARTGKAEQVARVELLRCAARVASLVVEPCTAFEKLREDTPAAEKAYADYLAGRLRPQDAALLPEQQRAVAAAPSDAALQSIEDPLSRMVAAGVMFQTGKASPAVIASAVETASAQGWRRPLMAWLMVQLQRAEAAGAAAEAARLRRRIALVESGGR